MQIHLCGIDGFNPAEKAYLYRAELALRLGHPELARQSHLATTALALTDAEQAEVANEIAHVGELVRQL